MNALYDLGARSSMPSRSGSELLTGGELDNKQFNDFVSTGPLTAVLRQADTSIRRAC